MKPEKPDFFLSTLGILVSLVSSECLFPAGPASVFDELVFSFITCVSVEETFEYCRRGGGGEWPIARVLLALACDNGGRAAAVLLLLLSLPLPLKPLMGLLVELYVGDIAVGDFVASMRLSIALPSKGAPISSSEVLVPRG